MAQPRLRVSVKYGRGRWDVDGTKDLRFTLGARFRGVLAALNISAAGWSVRLRAYEPATPRVLVLDELCTKEVTTSVPGDGGEVSCAAVLRTAYAELHFRVVLVSTTVDVNTPSGFAERRGDPWAADCLVRDTSAAVTPPAPQTFTSTAAAVLGGIASAGAATFTSGAGTFTSTGAATLGGICSAATATFTDTGPSSFVWTDFTPSVDTVKIYVSDSIGSNSNNGLSEAAPVKTLIYAWGLLRDAKPDWMLLKCGDTWTGQLLTIKSGRSATEKQLIGSYGVGARPRVIDQGFRSVNSTGNFAVVGIHFELMVGSVFTLPGGDIVSTSADNILLEDCYFGAYGSAVNVQGVGTLSIRNFAIRGCVLADSYTTDVSGHSQGILISNVDGALVEGCVVDHCGWHETIPDAEADIFNHNMYIQNTCANVVIRNTISARASSHGIQQRTGGLCEDNLFLKNPISVLFCLAGVCRRNVILDSRDIGPGSLERGNGLYIEDSSAEAYDNIIAHQVNGSKAVGLVLERITNASIHDNIIYNWTKAGGLTFGVIMNGTPLGVNTIDDNIFQQDLGTIVQLVTGAGTPALVFSDNNWFSADAQSTWFMLGATGSPTIPPAAWTAATGETGGAFAEIAFVDPTRKIETYAASLGLAPTLEGFLAAARAQSRANWSDALTAVGVNAYIRAGFVVV